MVVGMKLYSTDILRWACRQMCTTGAKIPTSIHKIVTEKPVGSVETIRGWIVAVRKYKNIIFLNVSDGSCCDSLQVVYLKSSTSQNVPVNASVDVTGEIKVNQREQIELHTNELKIIHNQISADYPFKMKSVQSYDHYRQFLHLRPQLQHFSSLLLLRNSVTQAIHRYFDENNFTGIHTPILSSNDCEGAGDVFNVQTNSQETLFDMKKESVPLENAFFDVPAYLTVSGQFHLECAARGITRTYTFGPCFRAENTRSRLHLSEFYMIEAEEAFVTDLKVILNRVEDFFKSITSQLLEKQSKEIELLLTHNQTLVGDHLKVLNNLIEKPFKVMTFAEAKSVLEKVHIEDAEKGSADNLTKAEEFFLVEHSGQVPVFVIDWPKTGKPFYMKTCKENKDLVEKVDLLVPNVGEVCGGSLREDDYDILKAKLKELKLNDSLKWYLDLRKYRNVPTGGFGIGFERYLQFLLNLQNIKDTIPFPRWPHALHM